jgi:hypothetical protein
VKAQSLTIAAQREDGPTYAGTNAEIGCCYCECSGGLFPNIGSTGSDAGRFEGATAEKAVPFPGAVRRSQFFLRSCFAGAILVA